MASMAAASPLAPLLTQTNSFQAPTVMAYHQQLAQHTHSVLESQNDASTVDCLLAESDSGFRSRSRSPVISDSRRSTIKAISQTHLPANKVVQAITVQSSALGEKLERLEGTAAPSQNTTTEAGSSVNVAPSDSQGSETEEAETVQPPRGAEQVRGRSRARIERSSTKEGEKQADYESRREAKFQRQRATLEVNVGFWLEGVLDAISQSSMVVEAPAESLEYSARSACSASGQTLTSSVIIQLSPLDAPQKHGHQHGHHQREHNDSSPCRGTGSSLGISYSQATCQQRGAPGLTFSTKASKATLRSRSPRINSPTTSNTNAAPLRLSESDEEKEWLLSVLSDKEWEAHLGLSGGESEGRDSGGISNKVMITGDMPTPRAVPAGSTYWG